MEIDTPRNFTAQFPRNLAANIAYFLVSVIVGILLVPFFVSTLGLAAYGLIPLATSITGYVAIVVQSLNTAVTRFLTVDLQKENYAAANQTFNTAFFGLTAVILLMVPIVVSVALLVPAIFSVPAGQAAGITFLFLGVCGSVLLRAWSGNFTVQLFAYNRLDLQNLVNLTNLLVQTGLTILLFYLFGPDLALVGGAYFVGAAVASALSIILAKRVCSHLILSIRSFDRSRIHDLLWMGWWVMLDQVGTLFLFQIDLIVVNMLFGAATAGGYAIALQWAATLRSVAGTLAGVLVPTIFAYYALKQTENIIKILLSAVKFMGLAMALPAALICGFVPQLLTIWVGAQYTILAPLMILLAAPQVLIMAVLPLFSIYAAHNKVRIPGIVSILSGVANLTLAIVLPTITGWGVYGVAIAGVITLTFRDMIFVPWYAGRVLGINGSRFLKSVVPGGLCFIIIGGFTFTFGTLFSLTSFFHLLIIGGLFTIVYLSIVWVILLSMEERKLFESYIPDSLIRYYSHFIHSNSR